jgi:hypothetical protein
MLLACLLIASFAFAWDPTYSPLLAQAQPTPPVDVRTARPRMMGLYEQGWNDGVDIGRSNSGKIGWFFAGFGNVPFLWLPWVVEPRRPAKPAIMAEEEYNNGYRHGYRAGWKNDHKTYYIAGAIVESLAAGAIIISQK